MKKFLYMSLAMALIPGVLACGDDNEPKDMTPPDITDTGITCNPVNCQVYHTGEVIPFRYVFEDNVELGNFNLEIHNNFDHHTHSTSSVECPMDEKKQPKKPWIYNQDFSIAPGQRTYSARHDIAIPADIDAGDYHFMVRLTDRAGWQQLHAVAIKIVE